MMAIIMMLALGATIWSATILLGRLPRIAHLPLAAAIMLGLTGYMIAGRPGMPGHDVAGPDRSGFGEVIRDPRMGMAQRFGPAAQWLGLSDGLMRAGNSAMAAEALQQGLRVHPRNVDLWVGFGNALVAHAGGVITPPAAIAFAKARRIDPAHPAPLFFAGLAMAQAGDVAGARAQWQELLARSPAEAPWRPMLLAQLAQIDAAAGATPGAAPVESPIISTAPAPAPEPAPAPARRTSEQRN
ncbi:MAG: tetratricopeptide repeat protein [Sphingopyxis sp.]